MQRRTVLAGVSSVPFLAGCLSDDGVNASGDIEIVIDGDPIDLSADRYQAENAENHSVRFHLHDGDENWYMEGEEPVTIAEGIDLLPHFRFETIEGNHVLEHDGVTYDEADATTELRALVDGEPVDPASYVPEDGDGLRLEVTTSRR